MTTQARFLALSCLAFVACDVETPPSTASTESTGDEDGGSESDGDGDGDDGQPICLNGIVEPGEECDAGMETWFCDPDCTYATCGDGYHNPLAEPCDDGNLDDNDACVGECSSNVCGDGMLWEPYEQCDDGNFDSTDECVSGCLTASCGDGYVHPGVEECDDGNDIDDDVCTNDCTEFLWWVSGPQTNVPTEQLSGWSHLRYQRRQCRRAPVLAQRPPRQRVLDRTWVALRRHPAAQQWHAVGAINLSRRLTEHGDQE